MSSSEYANSFERDGERFTTLFLQVLNNIFSDYDGTYSVRVDINFTHPTFSPFQRSYILQKDADGVKVLDSTETACPVPVDPSGQPSAIDMDSSYVDSSANDMAAAPYVDSSANDVAAPCVQPSCAPEPVGVSDEELQAFDAVISDPDINRQFILSLKRARCAMEVAEAVLRLVKNGVIDEDEACKKCFAKRILPFCLFPKGKSETNISNTIRNLLAKKHHDIKLSLQRLNQQSDPSCAHEGNRHL